MAKKAKPIEPGVLDELNRLGAERGPIAGWLAGLEAEREGVSEPVYRRVREDYSKRIADLDRLARPLRIEATRTVAALDEQLAQLETEKGEADLDLQEIELRHRLEEYSDAEFEKRAKVPRERIEELGVELEKIRATRELWLAARGEEITEPEAPETPASPLATQAAGSTAAAGIAPAAPAASAPGAGTATLVPEAPRTPAAPMPPMPPPPGGAAPSKVEITLPHPIPPPRPSSPAIPLPRTADAAAATLYMSSPTPIPPPPPAPVAGRNPPPLERTVVLAPEAPSPLAPDSPGSGASGQRLKATLVPVDEASPQGHPLSDLNTIGRVAENSIQIQQGSVSRHHAILRFTVEGWTLEDLEAENGTWVNGERIEKRQLLDGDRVNIGTVRFLFRIG